jgi:hypothetical protein
MILGATGCSANSPKLYSVKGGYTGSKGFFENILKPTVNRAKTGKVHLFFVDASHFVMGGFAGHFWPPVSALQESN